MNFFFFGTKWPEHNYYGKCLLGEAHLCVKGAQYFCHNLSYCYMV